MKARLDRPQILLGLLALAIIGAFLLLHGNYLISALVLAAIYAIVITGLVLLTGLNGQYSLGHAAFFGIGAYTSALLTIAGVPPLLASAAAIAITGAFGAIIGVPLLRLRGYYLAVATLAFQLIMLSVLNGWRQVTLGPSGMANIPPYAIGRWVVRGESAYYWLTWIVAFLCIWGGVNLWRSRIGQALLAIKSDEAAAAAMGINVSALKVQIFALSAALAGLGGSLYAHYVTFISPERFGPIASFELLLGALLGGVGTPFGAILGALLLIALPEVVAPLRDYKVMVYGIVFILVSLYLPLGIAGLIQGTYVRLCGGRRPGALAAQTGKTEAGA